MIQTVTKIEGEAYTHRLLWAAAQRLWKAAEDEPRGAFYGHLTSMLMAYFAVEGYVNFLLDVLDPELFSREKKEFGSSLDAKIDWACGRANLKFAKGEWPYQAFASLSELRHKVVHAKPDRYKDRLENVDPDSVPMFREGEIERRVSPEESTKALAAVSDICERLHRALYECANHEQRLRLQNYALEGTTQTQTTHTSATPTTGMVT